MLEQSHKSFPLKQDFGKQDINLGAKLHKTRLHKAMSSVKYVYEAVRNCAVHSAADYGGRFN